MNHHADQSEHDVQPNYSAARCIRSAFAIGAAFVISAARSAIRLRSNIMTRGAKPLSSSSFGTFQQQTVQHRMRRSQREMNAPVALRYSVASYASSTW